MSSPPPDDTPPSGYGDGSGPSQGFGPPPASRGRHGRRAHAATVTPAPRRPSGGKGARVVGTLVGVVVVLAVVIGGIVWLGSGYDSEGTRAGSAGAAPAVSSSADTSAGGGGGGSSDLPGTAMSDSPGADPTGAPADIPYVKPAPGTCFDSPTLDTAVNVVTTVSCASPHDGQVISQEHLTGTFTGEQRLRAEAIALCAPDATHRLKSLPKGGALYYDYAFYPDLTTYETKGQNTVSCSLTLSDTPDGRQLTAPLP